MLPSPFWVELHEQNNHREGPTRIGHSVLFRCLLANLVVTLNRDRAVLNQYLTDQLGCVKDRSGEIGFGQHSFK